jgi:hypothetical protein
MSLRNGARMLALTLAAVFGLVTLLPMVSYAGTAGRRNTTLGLGAAAIYLLAKGKTGSGLVAAAGTAYAYKRYRDSARHKRHYSYNRRVRYISSRRHHNHRYASNGRRHPAARYRVARRNNGRHLGWHKGRRASYRRTADASCCRRA